MNLNRILCSRIALRATVAFMLAVPFTARAAFTDQLQSGLKTAGTPAGLDASPPLEVMVGNIINVVLGLLGILLFGYLVYAGFLWMTSGGSEEGVKKAKTMIKNAVIGLVITVLAYAIAGFVITQIVEMQGATGS